MISKMMQVVEELSSLRLDVLDADWVQGIYYSEFLEFGEFPAEYESVLESLEVRKTFKRIMRAINAWLISDESDEDKSWAALTNHVPHQKLLAILAYYIDFGTKNVVTKEYRNNALLASRVYYKFIAVPGYKVYQIYHSQLFAHSLACLGFPKAMCDSEDSYFNTKELTNEVNSVITELRHFVLDLRSIMDTLQLNPTDMNFEDILSNLVDITGGAIVNRLNVDKIELANISGVIYEIIDFLICDAEREPSVGAIRLLFKCVLPKLVAASADCKNANNLVRASYVTYSGLLLSKYGKAALPGYTVLLQHLCYTPDGLERGEVRQARMQLVVGLMSLLPRKSYRTFVRWLLTLSATARVAHRQIALEILAKLLCNEPEEEKLKLPEPESNAVELPSQLTMECAVVLQDSNIDGLVSAINTNVSENPPDVEMAEVEVPTKDVETAEVSKDNETSCNDREPVKENITSEIQEECEMNEIPPNGETIPEPSRDGEAEQLANFSDMFEVSPDFEMAEILPKEKVEALKSLQTAAEGEPPLSKEEETTSENTPDGEKVQPELIPDGEITPEFTLNGETTAEQTEETAGVPKDGETITEPSHDGETTTEPPKDGAPSIEQTNTDANESTAQQSGEGETTEVAQSIVTNDAASESSQDSQLQADAEMMEEDVAGLLRARAHTVPHGQVLRAVYERLNDSASTLRARAFYILGDCVGSQHAPHARAMKELAGSGPVSRLMAAAASGVCDERAAVRRAALQLVHRSLSAPSESMPQSEDLAILVSLCRDASIIVRAAAVAALGELATLRPCEAVFDAFLNGPMYQLSDPEAKVQEQVTNLIQQMLMERLQKYLPGGAGNEDPIPWMFLDAVTRHNMSRHLQKACLLLAKANTGVNIRLVDVCSTHLGSGAAGRDLHCLVLLTSVAQHVAYSDVGFAVDYYYRLVADAPRRAEEPRLVALTLELLTLWAHWLRPEPRAALRDRVVARLVSATDDGCRLASVSLAAHLDPGNLVWATELMQISERRALAGTDIDEWLRACDLCLVAPEPPDPGLLTLMLHALNEPPPEWTEEQRGACVAGCGRLCVRSRYAAVLAAPALAALLRDPAAPHCARHNALLALADICTRYTCIVEPLLDAVCGCVALLTPPLLRRAAARALTRLLLGGYLRLRTPLYYRYCALLADKDHEVREPAEYYVTSCLEVSAIFHHFVDCILHYNKQDTDTLSFDSRQLIYDVMLQRLSIVQRLNLQCRLAREILDHAADVTDEGDGELPPELNAALLDTITLLCGPRMKLPKKPQRDGGEAGDLDDLQERVTTNIVSHKMKCMVAEVLVPAVLRLYTRLGPRGGQVAAYLVRITNDLLNDYRHEIEELIENDEELVKRINQYQETIGSQPSFGNTRNLVTASTAHEPETPRAPRRRARPSRTPRKRALNI